MVLVGLAAWMASPIRRLTTAEMDAIATLGPIGVAPLAYFGAQSWLGYSTRHDPRLMCPRCTGSLYLDHRTVIATRTCPRCGGRALYDPGKVKKDLWLDPEL
jgi:hypothetical protein